MKRDEYMDGAGLEQGRSDALMSDKRVTDHDHNRRIAWWREARFGLFVHWGPYSILGGMWNGERVDANYSEHIQLRGKIPVTEYAEAAAGMNPEAFDAHEWVALAKRSGAKYVIVTAKHHDGFAMYDSKVSEYSITRHAHFPRDPIKELAEACEAEGIRLGIYYSHAMDWHHPDSQGNTLDYPGNIGAWDQLEEWIEDDDKRERFERYLHEKALPQVEELLTDYGPIGLMWFDCGHKISDEHAVWFYDLVRRLQPDCLINKRLRDDRFADYGNPHDNQLRFHPVQRDWESIHTLNDSWGFRYDDDHWKSPDELIEQLLRVAATNGNLVLNVGPLGDGAIDDTSRSLLETVGSFLERNGEAIYGTSGSPIGTPQWGYCTWKPEENILYLLVRDWPQGGFLILPGLASGVQYARPIGAKAKMGHLPFRKLGPWDWQIDVRSVPQDAYATVIELKLNGEQLESNGTPRFISSMPNTFWAYDGVIEGDGLRYDNGKRGHDGVTGWTAPNVAVQWTFRSEEEVPVQCRVIVTLAAGADQAGGRYELSLDGQKLTCTAFDTGGDGCWGEFEMGQLTILSAGVHHLEVRGLSLVSDSLMNLRKVTLLPIERV
ncbi:MULTISPECIES: alpha-L-fucosidase [Paenibacillus]|uniref:alpha-L-fucosidase n=1 Tax=Paenibacillus lautus TaxID=1401 RepID=A0A1R1B1R7_PAELA|nr:alpha-L-fucosidase [Paenibacillus lautus]OME92759.1 alpha-L-fucosidase [Paenibacillus lautus]